MQRLIQGINEQIPSAAKFKPKKERKTMDPITLATAATTLLAPFIKKAGTAVLDKLAEQLPDTLARFGMPSRTNLTASQKRRATLPKIRMIHLTKRISRDDCRRRLKKIRNLQA
jgi:hypothetical protein